MEHKCPNCNTSLIPTIRVCIDIHCMWELHKISAERAMHLKKENHSCWECPQCGWRLWSEIQAKFIFVEHTYTRLEKCIRREGR